MSRERDVIVFLETFGEDADRINRGLLAEGHRIARILGGNLAAIFLGHPGPDQAMLTAHGASTLFHVDGDALAEYNCEAFGWAATTALKNIPFRMLLFAYSDMGSEVSAIVASRLGTTAIADCVDIRADEGNLIYTKSVYAGQFELEISFAEEAREIAAMRTDLLAIRETPAAKAPSVVRIPVIVPPEILRTRRLELLPPDSKTVDILYSDRIVGAGYGCMEPGLLSLVQELSELLGSSIGATRPLVDDGTFPRMRMIGQTGKTVSPALYLALGISGSPHHISGIQQSQKILSVNRDPRAPIFNFSDAGFVADLKSLLPRLIDRIKQYQAGDQA
jgi:electron transfer flavoprotein alpha subunit